MRCFFFPIMFVFITLSCNQYIPSSDNKNVSGTCKDTLLVFKQVTLPGVQQTDLDGNTIYKQDISYQLFLLSGLNNLEIDSVQTGKYMNKNLQITKDNNSPIYWNTASEKLLLVPKTTCMLYKILFGYTVKEQVGEYEENNIVVYYRQDGVERKMSSTKASVLPNRTTE